MNQSPRQFSVSISIALMVVISRSAVAWGDGLSKQDLGMVGVVCTKNQATVESIQSFYCKFNIDASRSSEWKRYHRSGEFWRMGAEARLFVTSKNGDVDNCYMSPSKMVNTHWNPRSCPRGSATIQRDTHRSYLIFHDPFVEGLIYFDMTRGNLDLTEPLTDDRVYTLSELVNAYRDRIKSIRTVTRQGSQLELVINHPKKSYIEHCITIDPDRNYLVSKIETRNAEGADLSASHGRHFSFGKVVRTFTTVRPGFSFPSEIETFSSNTGNGKGKSDPDVVKVTLRDVSINRLLSPDLLRPVIKPGMAVGDFIDKVSYTVGPDMSRIKIQTTADGMPPPISAPPSPRQSAVADSVAEPSSWTEWVLPFSAIMLTCSLIFVFRRRRAGYRRSQ